MALEVASLFAKIGADTSGLENGLNKAKGSVDSFVGVIGKIGAALGAVFAVREIAKFTSETIKLASDMYETLSKTNVVYGEQAAEIIKWAESAALSMGMSERAALDAASTFGNLFSSMGITSEAGLLMSKNLVRLASDLASFHNIDPSEALAKLRSGLAGETEPLRSLGININEAVLKAKALQMGLIGVGQEMNAAARAQAAYVLMIEQSTNAIGDFQRTSDGLANQQRSLKAIWEDLKTSLGNAFLPLATTITTSLTAAGTAVAPALDNIAATIRNWSIGLISNFFYWGANMVQSLANGIAGSGAVVDALNALGSYFTMMLEAHSPPKLLPDLEKWGAGAAAAYFEGWIGSTPTSKGILDKWTKALQPMLEQISGGGSYSEDMGKQLTKQFGMSGAVLSEYISSYSDLRDASKGVSDAQKEYDDIALTGDEEQIANAKKKLDGAKDVESQARARYALARSRVRAEAEQQAALLQATQAQTQAIKEQGAVLKDQSAAQAEMAQKAIDAARLSWQMAQADTAGKIKLLDEESKKYAEGSVEWYQLQTQKINLEKQLQNEQEKTAGAGGGLAALSTPITAALDALDLLNDRVKKTGISIGDGLVIDPFTMQIEKEKPNLFVLIQNLGKSMGGQFIGDFLDEVWKRFKESLALDPNATLGETLTTFGQNLGDTLGQAMYDAVANKLNQAWNNFLDSLAIVRGQNSGEWGYDFFGRFSGSRNTGADQGNPVPDSITSGWQTQSSRPASTESGRTGGNTYITINTNDQGVIRQLRQLGAQV